MPNSYKILLESSAEIKFEKLKNQQAIVVYGSKRKRDKLLELAKNAGLKFCNLKSPDFYLSPKRLEQFLQKKSFSDFETVFLLKIINWKDQTESGDREELTFEREQYGFFDLISDSEGDDEFFKKALEYAAECDVILMHQYDFAKGLAEKIPNDGERELIMVEASCMEDNFTNALKHRLTEANLQPKFGDKITLLFGLMGIFYERFVPVDSSEYRGNVIVDREKRISIEWRRFFEAAQNLGAPEIISALDEESNTVKWISSFYNELTFTSAPIDISEYFQKCIESFKKITLQSPALSADGSFLFIKNLLGLGEGWQQIPSFAGMTEKQIPASAGMTNQYENLKIEVPENFPAPNTEGYFKRCLKLFIELIEKNHGRCLFILSSKKVVDAFYSALLPETEELKTRLRAVGPSGGMGKSVALFLENPGSSVLLATNQILAHFEEIEDEINIVAFQKIPFDLPFDPLVAARGERVKNSFRDYSLPRAIMRFKEILIELGKGEKSRTCWILDRRIITQDYGRFFL